MKKLSILLFVMLGTITMSHAQFYAGAKMGVIVADASASESIEIINSQLNARTGFNYGVTAEYFISPSVSLRSELLFTERGFNINQATNVNVIGIDIPIGAKLALDVNYLEVPILAQYNHSIGNIDLFLNAGPSISYASSASLRTKATLLIDFNIAETDINLDSDYIDRTDINLNIGGGAAVNTAQGRFMIDMRYGQALNSAISETFIDTRLANNAMQFNFGYQHRF
jgi:hypothetical protein